MDPIIMNVYLPHSIIVWSMLGLIPLIVIFKLIYKLLELVPGM